jgi:protocatechuate 3,4-dioxygenase beta subunit
MHGRKKAAAVVVALLTLMVAVLWWRARPRSGPEAPVATTAAPPTQAPRLRAVVAEGGTVEVEVRDPSGPAAEAFVLVSRGSARRGEESTLPALVASSRTDRAGAVRFTNLAPGTYVVTASSPAPGLIPAVQSGVEIATGGTVSVQLVLARGGLVLSGRVTDSGSGPIAGARVTATQPGGDEASGALLFFAGATDHKGAFALTLRAGIYSVVAQADGYPRKSQLVSLQADTTLDFRLDPGTQISGRVVMRDTREPVPGARVRAVPVERAGYRRPGVETDAEGRFTLPAVAPGDWQIAARKGPLVGSGPPMRVVAALPIEGIDIEVERAFGISGRVTDPAGAPAADILVVAELGGTTEGGGAATGPDGTFAIEGLVPGAYELTAQPRQEGPRAYGTVTITDRDVAAVELRLPAPVMVQGQVTDGAGAPAPQVRVIAIMGQGAARSRDLSRSSIQLTDGTGRFAFRGLEAGALSLRGEGKAGGIATWGPETVKPGEARQVALRLTDGATLVGKVSYPDGAPAAGARVSVRSPEDRRGRVSSAVVGPDGRYALRSLIPGTALAVAHRSKAPTFEGSSPVSLAADRETTLDLTLPGPASIRGLALLPDRRPAAGALVVASTAPAKPSLSQSASATADIDGSFLIEELDAGSTYKLWADMPGYAAQAPAVAGTKDVLLVLEAPRPP